MPDGTPRLVHFRVSHYNEKVRWALDHKRWPHLREAQLPGLHVPRARWLTGQSKLPILILDGRALAGSNRILEEIERRRPDPPLFPAGARERERALALEAHFDDEVAPDLRRLFWSAYIDDAAACARMAADGFAPAAERGFRALWPVLRPAFRRNMGLGSEHVARARARLAGHFDRLEAELGPGGYLVGERFGVADLTAAAVMTAIIRPPQFSYPLPEPWPHALVELRASVAGRPGFRWVLDVYERHRGASSEIRSHARA